MKKHRLWMSAIALSTVMATTPIVTNAVNPIIAYAQNNADQEAKAIIEQLIKNEPINAQQARKIPAEDLVALSKKYNTTKDLYLAIAKQENGLIDSQDYDAYKSLVKKLDISNAEVVKADAKKVLDKFLDSKQEDETAVLKEIKDYIKSKAAEYDKKEAEYQKQQANKPKETAENSDNTASNSQPQQQNNNAPTSAPVDGHTNNGARGGDDIAQMREDLYNNAPFSQDEAFKLLNVEKAWAILQGNPVTKETADAIINDQPETFEPRVKQLMAELEAEHGLTRDKLNQAGVKMTDILWAAHHNAVNGGAKGVYGELQAMGFKFDEPKPAEDQKKEEKPAEEPKKEEKPAEQQKEEKPAEEAKPEGQEQAKEEAKNTTEEANDPDAETKKAAEEKTKKANEIAEKLIAETPLTKEQRDQLIDDQLIEAGDGKEAKDAFNTLIEKSPAIFKNEIDRISEAIKEKGYDRTQAENPIKDGELLWAELDVFRLENKENFDKLVEVLKEKYPLKVVEEQPTEKKEEQPTEKKEEPSSTSDDASSQTQPTEESKSTDTNNQSSTADQPAQDKKDNKQDKPQDDNKQPNQPSPEAESKRKEFTIETAEDKNVNVADLRSRLLSNTPFTKEQLNQISDDDLLKIYQQCMNQVDDTGYTDPSQGDIYVSIYNKIGQVRPELIKPEADKIRQQIIKDNKIDQSITQINDIQLMWTIYNYQITNNQQTNITNINYPGYYRYWRRWYPYYIERNHYIYVERTPEQKSELNPGNKVELPMPSSGQSAKKLRIDMNENELPDTGERSPWGTIGIGVVIAILAGFFLVKRRPKS